MSEILKIDPAVVGLSRDPSPCGDDGPIMPP